MDKIKITGLLWLLLIVAHSGAETISLDSCRTLARNHYPLIHQAGLIEQTRQFSVEAVEKGWLPRVSLSVRASYQSDITELPEALTSVLSRQMGVPLEPFQKRDQYQAVLDVSQLIWDGGQMKAQKSAINANALVERQKAETDLYALNERINNLYFGILLLKEQLEGQTILMDELHQNLKKAESLKANGLLLQADVDAVKVELITARQRINELQSNLKNYCQVLSAFTGLTINEKSVLQLPVAELPAAMENNRPELNMFDAQHQYLDSQEKAVYASVLPKVGAFLQGGYGRPSLNMFNPSLAPYTIGGIRLNWDLSSMYTRRTQLDKIAVSKKSVEVMRETFLFNNAIQRTQHQLEMEKIRENLKTDDELINLRFTIKRSAEAKWHNGTLTVTDLLREINAEHLARQQKKVHMIQLCMAVYQLKTDSNNY